LRINVQRTIGDGLSLPRNSFWNDGRPLSNGGAGNAKRSCGGGLALEVGDDFGLKHGRRMYKTLSTDVKHSNARTEQNQFMGTMAERIKTLREAQGMTQTELAKLVGVSRGGVAQWELGLVQNIRLQAFLKLCDALRTDPQYLIFGTDRGRAKSRPQSYGH